MASPQQSEYNPRSMTGPELLQALQDPEVRQGVKGALGLPSDSVAESLRELAAAQARTGTSVKEAAMNRDPELQKAWEEVERLNRDPATRQLAWERETALMSYEIGLGAAHQEGRAEGRVEGRVEDRAESVLEVLEARGLSVSEEQRARILSCEDLEVLRQWHCRAVTADCTEDVFAD